MPISHSELCDVGVTILRDMIQCDIYGRDVAGARSGEHADCFGVSKYESHLIEAKVTRDDFLFDRQKPWRQCNNNPKYKGELGMKDEGVGNFRYYLVPEELNWQSLFSGLIYFGWGMYELRDDGAHLVIEPERFHRPNMFAERNMLLSLMRKMRHHDGNGRAISKETEWIEGCAEFVLKGHRVRDAMRDYQGVMPFRNAAEAERALKDHIKQTHDLISGRAVRRETV